MRKYMYIHFVINENKAPYQKTWKQRNTLVYCLFYIFLSFVKIHQYNKSLFFRII